MIDEKSQLRRLRNFKDGSSPPDSYALATIQLGECTVSFMYLRGGHGSCFVLLGRIWAR